MSDNCCWCNFSAMRLKTGVVDDDDVVFFNYQNSYGETPYYVVRDHERRSIVVCIRGSMSLNDALTDFNATPALFEENSEHWCHQGILYAARYVYQELQTRQLLEQAFDGFERYDLVVVGHSLGAATAALLSIMLAPRYEARLKCFAYSSPSGLMSASLTKRCTEYCLSVVVGRDIVPQLSVPNLARFRDEMVAAVQQSTRPKYDILANGVRSAITSVLTNRKTSENELDLEAGVREQQPFLALPGMSESSTTVRMPMPTYEYEADAVSCLPGRVLHLINAEPPNVATEIKKQYVACWRDKQFFTRIMLSTEAITEHMPDVVQNALEDVCKDISFKSGVHL
ncbi:hypothetical protein SARC_01670 [Sphaeroforma arctica JP610]|uniref:sn-1-specific diacylglycerol lipase n=1 Tax=Sphaeroforma arctica JP610 TaxID=667725 RepID=A0A0L0GD77_9EUKA|nr:hypothetical protein SARC_01670 [Sphaeroforma arctica JP610]KNC86193.1 hypothetical protein SARC_01670 [Sphaeroforma arctica JP610]|eukprot:XP_014160095.1 hypothetical protein SARC_01670 [Sphaeroforma arctica JP610]